jgi:hypothetical protein
LLVNIKLIQTIRFFQLNETMDNNMEDKTIVRGTELYQNMTPGVELQRNTAGITVNDVVYWAGAPFERHHACRSEILPQG